MGKCTAFTLTLHCTIHSLFSSTVLLPMGGTNTTQVPFRRTFNFFFLFSFRRVVGRQPCTFHSHFPLSFSHSVVAYSVSFFKKKNKKIIKKKSGMDTHSPGQLFSFMSPDSCVMFLLEKKFLLNKYFIWSYRLDHYLKDKKYPGYLHLCRHYIS